MGIDSPCENEKGQYIFHLKLFLGERQKEEDLSDLMLKHSGGVKKVPAIAEGSKVAVGYGGL
jgi:hypothetical protein